MSSILTLLIIGILLYGYRNAKALERAKRYGLRGRNQS